MTQPWKKTMWKEGQKVVQICKTQNNKNKNKNKMQVNF